MEGLRDFKNYTLLDNISIVALKSLLNEYPELNIGKNETTLNLRYAVLPNSASNWTILEWNSDEELNDDTYFWLYQNISSWLSENTNTKGATEFFNLAFEADSPQIPTFYSKLDPENPDNDTIVGIYEEEHFSYFLATGEDGLGEEVDIKFDLVEFLLDEYDFEIDWLVDADSFEWEQLSLTIEFDDI